MIKTIVASLGKKRNMRQSHAGIDRGSLTCQIAPEAELKQLRPCLFSQISAKSRGRPGARSNYLRAAKTCILASQEDNLTCNHNGHPQSCSVTSEAHVGQVDKIYNQLMLCL